MGYDGSFGFVGCRTETNLYYTFNHFFFLKIESPFES